MQFVTKLYVYGVPHFLYVFSFLSRRAKNLYLKCGKSLLPEMKALVPKAQSSSTLSALCLDKAKYLSNSSYWGPPPFGLKLDQFHWVRKVPDMRVDNRYLLFSLDDWAKYLLLRRRCAEVPRSQFSTPQESTINLPKESIPQGVNLLPKESQQSFLWMLVHSVTQL